MRYKGNWVGTVESCWGESGTLELTDIMIFERYSYLRHRGLGKKMMQCFIKRAKEEGAHHIWGFIHPHEGSTKEYLIKWYQELGFLVYEVKPGIHHILLNLRNQQT